MPASSSELIDAALFSAFSKKLSDDTEETPYASAEACISSIKQASLIDFELEPFVSKHQLNFGATSFENLRNKYGTLKGNQANTKPSSTSKNAEMALSRTEDKLEDPRTVLWSPDKVALGWRKNFPPGAGMVNLGNTCYMNASLQALFHIPSLVNWLLEEASTHIPSCEANTYNSSFCSICGMMRTLKQVLDRSNTVIKPQNIHNKLKCIGKTLIYGRQEDAHEFIKLLLDHMEKSFLTSMKATKLDHRSKETTPLNQIFGGYLRQQVICPLCCYVSTTFSHFQDIVLDIRSVGSVDDALNLYFRKETLDSDNAYKCEKCHRKVPATKRHLIERAPHVLLIQLKRFTVSGGKITKHVNIQKTIDLSRYVNGVKSSNPNGGGPYFYKLVSMVIHIGGSQHGGHYTAIAEAANKTMFEFDDSSVRPISLQSALLRNPYILFYEMVHKPKNNVHSIKHVMRQSSEKVLLKQSYGEKISKPIPTSHSTNSMCNRVSSSINSHEDIGEVVGRNGTIPNKSTNMFLNLKEREKVSFGIKRNSTGNEGAIGKYTKSGNSFNNLSSSLQKKNGYAASQLVPYKDDSEDSDEGKSNKRLTNGFIVKENGHSSSGSESFNMINGVKIGKSYACEQLDGDIKHQGNKNRQTSFLPRTLQAALASKNGVSSNTESSKSVYSNLTNGFTSDKSKLNNPKGLEDVDNRLAADEHLSNDVTGKARNYSGPDVERRESSNESSCSSTLSREFVTSEKVKSNFLEKEGRQSEGHFSWSGPNRKRKPELEKSLSNDSVLPSVSRTNDKTETASLKSKNSLDSNRSDKSSRSVKRSIFSMFPCVSSAQSSELSPEHECMRSIVENKEDSTPVKEDIKSNWGGHPGNRNLSSPGGSAEDSSADSPFSKRNRGNEEQTPASPSKKSKSGDRIFISEGENCTGETFVKSKHKIDDTRYNGANPKNEISNEILPYHESISERKSVKNEENFWMEKKTKRHKIKKKYCEYVSGESSYSADNNAKRDMVNGLEERTCSRTILNKNVTEIPWGRHVKDLSDRLMESKHSEIIAQGQNMTCYRNWGEWKTSSVTEELTRAGDYPFGVPVSTWDGSDSVLDTETQRARNEARKRTADEIYDEELDTGKVPKKKYRSFSYGDPSMRENPFQKYQDVHINYKQRPRNRSWNDVPNRNFKHYRNNFNNKNHYCHSYPRPFFKQNSYHVNTFGRKHWQQRSGASRGNYHNKNNGNFRYYRH